MIKKPKIDSSLRLTYHIKDTKTSIFKKDENQTLLYVTRNFVKIIFDLL